MEPNQLQQAILDFVGRAQYKPVKPRVIAERLGFAKDDHRDVKRAIKRLVRQGRLQFGSNHLVRPASGLHSDLVTGVFRRTRGGFGFVRPRGATRGGEPPSDIYVKADRAGDASTGDVVLVRLGKGHGRGANPEGTIVEVIERDTHEFVGTYFEAAGTANVDVDGTLFTQPVVVGDPGAKNAKPGDKVVFEMVRFPSFIASGEGVISEVLGPRGAPGVDTLSIIREYNLPDEFAEDALEEARRQADKFDESDTKGRVDLTDETVITIDPADARDFDDAISLERLENGHWRLGVHIADVVHFVRRRSSLDREARQRATSVYLPDRVIPMLPEVISNGLASLQPNRMRYTKTAFIEFTADGARVGSELVRAAIKSKRRFAYEEVDDFLANRSAWRRKLTAKVHGLLERMFELAMILKERRLRNGSIVLSMREVKVDLDADGKVCGAHAVEQTESHQMIEEFMLAANEAVAETLAEAELDFLRRVHEAPDPRKLKELTKFVNDLGIKSESLESRFEIQRVLDLVEGQPEEHAVNFAVLRSLQRAHYSPEEEGHYALASECYCHFTSPIRRYPDLTIHRLIDSLLSKRKSTSHREELFALGEHCSACERRAEAAERDLTKVKLLAYLEERIGMELEAIITSVADFGFFAAGVDLPADGLIHVSSLVDDFYRFDRAAHSLIGTRSGIIYRLGDRLRVAVARVDVDRRQLDFRIVKRLRRPASTAKSKNAGKGSKAASQRQGKKSKKPAKRKTRR